MSAAFGGGGFRRAHTELTRGVLQAARSAGVHSAAAGLRAQGRGRRAELLPAHQGRGGAADPRAERDLDWTIFQPSVMFGPGDSFLNRFARLLASIPLRLSRWRRPNARFQPVFVDDVIDAMLRCLHGGAVQPSDLSSSAVLRSTRCGKSSAWSRASRASAAGSSACRISRRGCRRCVMDFVPGRPFSSDNYRSLTVDSVCTEDGFAKLKLTPHSMVACARQYLGALEDNARLEPRPRCGRPVQGRVMSTPAVRPPSGRSGHDRPYCRRSRSGCGFALAAQHRIAPRLIEARQCIHSLIKRRQSFRPPPRVRA